MGKNSIHKIQRYYSYKKESTMKENYSSYKEYCQDLIEERIDENTKYNNKRKTIHHYAIIMIANKGAMSRPKALFAMELHEAMELCSDSRTLWKSSMLIWSHLENFTNGVQGDCLSPKKIRKDSGYSDDVIKELGLTKIPPKEWKDLFEPLGVEIK